MRRVLVTGATGFIGRNVAAALRGHADMAVLTTARSGAVDFAGVDMASPRDVARLLGEASPDAVVHCVGVRHGTTGELREGNVATLRNVLAAAAARPVPPRVVTMGSAAEYGPRDTGGRIAETARCRPASDYGRTKLTATRLARRCARRNGLPVTVLRLFNVVGEGMGGLLGEVAGLLEGKGAPVDWRKEAHSLPLVRDFVSVEDVATVCRLVIGTGNVPTILNVCTGVGRSFGAMLDALQAVSGRAIGHPRSSPHGEGIVGDPALCREAIGFAPSADLSRALRQAIGREGAGR